MGVLILIGSFEVKAKQKKISAILDFQCKDYVKHIFTRDEKYSISIWNGFQVLFIFATNGRYFVSQFEIEYGIWFQDLRISSNAPTALRSWISPDRILKLPDENIPSSNENLQSMAKKFLTYESGLNFR